METENMANPKDELSDQILPLVIEGFSERSSTIRMSVDNALGMAMQQLQGSNYVDCESILSAILQSYPEQPDTLHLYGLLCFQLGRYDEAIEHFRAAILQEPQNPSHWLNMGLVCCGAGNLDAALKCCREAIEIEPISVDAFNLLGIVQQRQKNLVASEKAFRAALAIEPTFAAAHINLANVLHEQAFGSEINPFRAVVAEAREQVGQDLQQAKRYAEAVQQYEEAIRLAPDRAETYFNLASVLQDQGDDARAQEMYRHALSVKPDFPEALNNLGTLVYRAGHFQEAFGMFARILEMQPQNVEAMNNIALAAQMQGRALDAITWWDRALELRPDWNDARFNRSICYLAEGDYERGYAEYECRWDQKARPRPILDIPLWDGRQLHGETVLLQAEQGLGDTIQYCRLIPQVQARGANVILACQPRLKRLMRTLPWNAESSSWGNSAEISHRNPHGGLRFDSWIPLLSLPHVLGITLDTVPAPVPYLFAEKAKLWYWERKLALSPGFRIGIGWDPSPEFRHANHWRCVPVEAFAPIGKLRDVRLFGLQKGPGNDQLTRQVRDLKAGFAVFDLSPEIDLGEDAFVDTAAVMMNMDLVITADMSLAHLAGALGVPVWVALPYAPHWTWMRERTDTPWYPTMRLWRQSKMNDWGPVFAAMAEEIKQMTSA
jgi:tetratricopeptide (TPR) repeat protein